MRLPVGGGLGRPRVAAAFSCSGESRDADLLPDSAAQVLGSCVSEQGMKGAYGPMKCPCEPVRSRQ